MIAATRHTTGSPIRLLSAVRNGRRLAFQRQQRSQRTSRSNARNGQSFLVLRPSLCPAVLHRVAKTHREPTIPSKDLKRAGASAGGYASQGLEMYHTTPKARGDAERLSGEGCSSRFDIRSYVAWYSGGGTGASPLQVMSHCTTPTAL